MSYRIFGKNIKNEYIVLGTIFATVGTAVAASGGNKKPAGAPVPVAQDTSINTGNKEEDDFIRAFVAAGEKGDSAPAAH